MKWGACNTGADISAQTSVFGLLHGSHESSVARFGSSKVVSEKSVVRPTYSYLGDYKISEKVMADIAECVKRQCRGVSEIGKVAVFPSQEGVDIYISLNLKYGTNLHKEASEYQKLAAQKIEEMTAFNVNRLELDVRDVD